MVDKGGKARTDVLKLGFQDPQGSLSYRLGVLNNLL